MHRQGYVMQVPGQIDAFKIDDLDLVAFQEVCAVLEQWLSHGEHPGKVGRSFEK